MNWRIAVAMMFVLLEPLSRMVEGLFLAVSLA